MNRILERQNDQIFLDRLAAQRELYDQEKRLTTIWIVVSSLVAVLGSGALALLKMVNAYVTLGAILVMFSEFALLYFIRKRGQEAARIQELFDCDLLELPWNNEEAKKPDQATITTAAAHYRQRTTREQQEKLKNWYHNRIASMPLHQARIYCQQENIAWDLGQRREYITWVAVALIVLVLGPLVISIAANLPTQDFFTGPVVLILPILAAGIKHIWDHSLAIQRLVELQQSVDELVTDASKPDAKPDDLVHRSRNLQNKIFNHRTDDPPVFSWFYEIIRKKYEKLRPAP